MPPSNLYPSPQPGYNPTQQVVKSSHLSKGLLLPLIFCVVLLLAVLSFGIWAFMGRQDFKNNVNSKIDKAVKSAVASNSSAKEKEFSEREKEPLKEYKGPAAFGSVSIKYPKVWSAYITESDKGSVPVDGYFHPNYVPGLNSGTAFALRLQVTNVTYADELKKFDAAAKQGKVVVSTIAAESVPNVAGVKVDGEIENGVVGTVAMFPLRDKTLKLISESKEFKNDFDGFILKYLSFSP